MPNNNSALPVHVGIIMDGNGRWAKNQNLPRTNGHKEGLKVAKNIVKAASELGIKYVTLYTFSTENWKRAQEEVGYLMGLIKYHLRAELEFYKKNHIRVKHIGDLSGLPGDVQQEILSVVEQTNDFDGLTVVLAINYGGRDEIVRSIKKMLAEKTLPELVNESYVSKKFDVTELPDVDMLIRTGGEFRLSNFLLWHAAYAELFFTETLWPDYTAVEFLEQIESFQKRTRRFGGVLK
ncbi:MAG: polyprenyl diphosphate synthase [Treponema sp.]|nr:polyprenyl diphosphate synthase [Treponema sp.]